MFNRPNRYRYVNLATQQIRLRNILRLSAHNINNLRSQEANLFFTIHKNDSSSEQAFYTSPKVRSRKYNKRTFDWPDISYQSVDEGILKDICIKLWEDSCQSTEPLFSWSVQLRDLVFYDLDSKDSSIDSSVPSEKFNENSLELITNAGPFVIASSLTVEALREQLAVGYKGECKVSPIRFK